MLQGYLPAPSRGLSRGARRGKQRFLAGRLGYDGAIARQVIRPVHGADTERLANQKPLETRAVDKEITLNFSAIGQSHTSDETVVPLHHPCHLALGALESARFGVTAQIAGHQQCIDMQRIVCAANWSVAGLGRREEPAIFSHDAAGRKIQQRRRIAMGSRLEPALIEIVASNRAADDAEGMEVFLVALMPADKLDS